MTKKNRHLREALREEASRLVKEVLEGKWDHIEGVHNRPIGLLTPLFEELERRCPGLPKAAYEDAYCRAFNQYR